MASFDIIIIINPRTPTWYLMQPNPKKASKKSTAKALKKTELSFNMAMDIDD